MTVAKNLPSDLESEILARVPAKSLWKLKTTCKRWYALLRDPNFAAKNRKLSKCARETMVLTNHQVYSIAGDLHDSGEIESSLEFTGKLPNDLHMISHCDGLILSQAKVDEEGKEISWRKEFLFEVHFDKFELSHTANVLSFLLDEEKKVAVCCEFCEEEDSSGSSRTSVTNIYIVGEDVYRSVYNATAKGYRPLVLTYVPNLVRIY